MFMQSGDDVPGVPGVLDADLAACSRRTGRCGTTGEGWDEVPPPEFGDDVPLQLEPEAWTAR